MTASATANAAATTPAPPPLTNETLRERILTGGGGGNVRGSLTRAAARYAEFLRALASNGAEGSSSASSAAAAALQTELHLHDLEVRKRILSSRAADGNSARHAATLERMQSTLEETRHDIENLTTILAEERQIKKHREECNALAKMGNDKAPPVRETRAELERVQKEMEAVREEVDCARRELAIRERQTRALMACLGDLKATIREEDVRREVDASMSSEEKGGDDGEGEKATSTQGTKRKRPSDGGSDLTHL